VKKQLVLFSKVFGTIEAKLDTLKDDIDIEEDGHKYISKKHPEKKEQDIGGMLLKRVYGTNI
jgi:hypothetical protein